MKRKKTIYPIIGCFLFLLLIPSIVSGEEIVSEGNDLFEPETEEIEEKGVEQDEEERTDGGGGANHPEDDGGEFEGGTTRDSPDVQPDGLAQIAEKITQNGEKLESIDKHLSNISFFINLMIIFSGVILVYKIIYVILSPLLR